MTWSVPIGVTRSHRRTAEIKERVGGRTDVVLVGTGYLGRHVLADLRGLPYTVVAFVDNNPALWGSEVQGLEVLSPEARADFADNALWLITIYTNSRVIEQCRELGVPWVTCAELSWVLREPHPNSFIFGRPHKLAESIDEIEMAASIWADAESEAQYRSQIRWRFLLDYAALGTPRPMLELYFPDDLIHALDREVFVDCGAFTGDTIEAFLSARGGRFGEIVGVEPDAFSARVLQGRVDGWKQSGIGPMPRRVGGRGIPARDVEFRHHGNRRIEGRVRDRDGRGGQHSTIFSPGPSRPTSSSMSRALSTTHSIGGSETIRANMPVLAVCLYHRPEDLWDLPLLVRSLRPDYKIYVRRYSDERWETVLYAVPPERALR